MAEKLIEARELWPEVLFQTDLGMSPGHIGEVLSIKGRHLPNSPSGQSLHQTLISHTQLGEASCTVGQTCQVLSCAINCDQPIPSSDPQHAQAVYLVDSFLQPAPVHLQSVHLNGQLGYKFGCENWPPEHLPAGSPAYHRGMVVSKYPHGSGNVGQVLWLKIPLSVTQKVGQNIHQPLVEVHQP